MEPAIILNDTYKVLDCNDRALVLFRCDRAWLIGQTMPGLVANPEMRELAILRLETIRKMGDLHMQPSLPLRRKDGTVFVADVTTIAISRDEMLFRSTLVNIREN